FLLQHLEEAKAKGVVTASAGNHGQAVAAMSTRLGIAATIVMPTSTPALKTENAKRLGGRVELVGQTFEEAAEHARSLSEKGQRLYVHGYADPDVIAGQGTVALEMLSKDRFKDIEAVVVPVGGGGLAAGVCTVLRAKRPDINIYGVAAKNVPTCWELFHGKAPEAPSRRYTLAEGVAIKSTNAEIVGFLKEHLTDFFLIEEESIAHAIALLAERAKIVAEGAAALSVAVLLEEKIKENKVALLLSGGNVDLSTLSRVLQRGLVEQGRLARLHITGSDRPGLLHAITEVLYRTQANIIQVSHTRGTLNIGVGEAKIEVDIETRAPDHTQEIIEELKKTSLRVERVF
ncbi:MAG: pyridoxal-phosphate dependent enzyme, partial [Bdellovibrionales bacterium]|nr:pyridoxal-phosphate dependent enzyme [Bdellovibrionales bacterium]